MKSVSRIAITAIALGVLSPSVSIQKQEISVSLTHKTNAAPTRSYHGGYTRPVQRPTKPVQKPTKPIQKPNRPPIHRPPVHRPPVHRPPAYPIYPPVGGVIVTGAVIYPQSLSSDCSTIVKDGYSYLRCAGGEYYEPYYEGDELLYRAIRSPYKY